MQHPYEIDFISSIVENNKIIIEKRKFDNNLALLFNKNINLSINSNNKKLKTNNNNNKTNNNKRKREIL